MTLAAEVVVMHVDYDPVMQVALGLLMFTLGTVTVKALTPR